MADETPYPNELRLPISITLPATPRLTPEGRPWPLDPKGRPWPSRRGRPVYPVTYLPKGIAPGTGHLPPQGDGRTMLERFAAMDAAMYAEGRLAGERARAGRTGGIQLIADRREDSAPNGPPKGRPNGPQLSNRNAFDSGLASSPRDDAILIPQDAESRPRSVGLLDINGLQIVGASGAPAVTPQAFSPRFFAERGREDAGLYKNAIAAWEVSKQVAAGPTLDPSIPPQVTAFAMRGVDDLGLAGTPLSNFGHGRKWDVQRLNGRFEKEYRDAATIYIGIYGAASGIPEGMLQDIQNDYAQVNSGFASSEAKSNAFGSIAQTNVANLHIGYELFRNKQIN